MHGTGRLPVPPPPFTCRPKCECIRDIIYKSNDYICCEDSSFVKNADYLSFTTLRNEQPRSQGSLLPTLRRAGRREPWERG